MISVPLQIRCVSLGAAALALGACAAGPHEQSPTKKKTMDAVTYFTDPKQIAMANAVKNDDVGRIKELARGGVNVNAPGEQGMTYVVWAMGHRRKNALRALLVAGADPNGTDTAGTPVMELAARDEDTDYLRLLLSAGGKPNTLNHSGEPLTFTAIGEMRWENMRVLVEKGADMNARGKDGSTAMLLLAGLNQFEEVDWLLQRGADIKPATDTGATLAWQVQRSRVDPSFPQAGWRDRVKAQLAARGVRFPVPAPGAGKP